MRIGIIKVSVIKLIEGSFKFQEIECKINGNSIRVDSEKSNEIMFDIWDDSVSLFLNGVFFNHRFKILKCKNGIVQSFDISLRRKEILGSSETLPQAIII